MTLREELAGMATVDWEKDIYREGKQLNRWPYSDVVSWFLRREPVLSARQEKSVLEVGFGAGNNLWFLATSGFQVSGVEVSETATKRASDRLEEIGLKAQLETANLLLLPFDDSCFDYVLDRACLTHISTTDLPQALSEIHRVLKPGGWIFSTTLFGLNHPDRIFGSEVVDGTFDNFTEGMFQAVGQTTFFDVYRIQRDFGKFSELQMSRNCSYEEGSEQLLVSETFTVEARKSFA